MLIIIYLSCGYADFILLVVKCVDCCEGVVCDVDHTRLEASRLGELLLLAGVVYLVYAVSCGGCDYLIDYFLVSERLNDKIVNASIHTQIMGSDHCPVSLELQ